jgi:2-iminobutanoate/2-iminopropanoate deaminase
MSKQVVKTAKAAQPVAPYSQAIIANGLVFVSGQVSLDAETHKLVGDDVQAQARLALTNLKVILEAAGSSLEKVVKTTVFLDDINDFGAVNEVYGTFFTQDPPARSAFQVGKLPVGAMVEIEAIALA